MGNKSAKEPEERRVLIDREKMQKAGVEKKTVEEKVETSRDSHEAMVKRNGNGPELGEQLRQLRSSFLRKGCGENRVTAILGEGRKNRGKTARKGTSRAKSIWQSKT